MDFGTGFILFIFGVAVFTYLMEALKNKVVEAYRSIKAEKAREKQYKNNHTPMGPMTYEEYLKANEATSIAYGSEDRNPQKRKK